MNNSDLMQYSWLFALCLILEWRDLRISVLSSALSAASAVSGA